MSVKILQGDCREVLASLPAESVHCVVSSPPYYGLRSYVDAGDPMKAFEIGLEETIEEYIAKLVDVFRAVRRVLRSDGTAWVNMGDSYANDGKWGGATGGKHCDYLHGGETRIGREKRRTGLKPKDLCGVPWRLAFALQQPDYLGRIGREADRAWLAALTDGEGCISILEAISPHGSGSSYPPILQVRMCDPQCIEKAMALVGSESENPPQYPPSQGGVRPAYQWRIHGRKAADTIAEIYPWLLIKRKQAVIAWNHQVVRDGYETKRGVKIPTDALEKQKVCRELIQNQKQSADLPSWMIEPPQPVGPGWYLRQDLIWSKPNPMPESVTDRCTKAHEYLFLLSKSERYYFDQEAIAEPCSPNTHARISQDLANQIGTHRANGGAKTNGPLKAVVKGSTRKLAEAGSGIKNNDSFTDAVCLLTEKRNRRSVWEVTTQPFSEAHFATFPPALIEPCILAGCPKGGTVLDPFGGAGTTGLVADRLGRNAIMIELNPEYVAMAKSRIEGDAGLFADVSADAPLFAAGGRS